MENRGLARSKLFNQEIDPQETPAAFPASKKLK